MDELFIGPGDVHTGNSRLHPRLFASRMPFRRAQPIERFRDTNFWPRFVEPHIRFDVIEMMEHESGSRASVFRGDCLHDALMLIFRACIVPLA